ncbi:hypothetical protein KGM_201871 [Danaus plexippus plexippus]|uniref:Uncharacterized protein n=1 Tax=Danaus plexippus plexippus TaxID=278856 RepID=A0A212EGU2_DANPL|nr:hypothetical protein KGM_201871 [Danaus plexippus plexippus]
MENCYQPQHTDHTLETKYDSKISVDTTSSNRIHIKSKSAPTTVLTKADEDGLKHQTSAPSYLHSLKDNLAPPFLKPEKQAKPHLLLGTIVTEDDLVEIIAASDSDPIDGLRKTLGQYLVKKKLIHNYSLSEKSFLVSLLMECIDYAAQRSFSTHKLACMLTLYLASHLYFRWYYWLPPVAVWKYFKEIMIRHTIEDSPDGQEVFEPKECYDILSHFHTIYLSNLPLVHILTFGVYRLKLSWPFKPK